MEKFDGFTIRRGVLMTALMAGSVLLGSCGGAGDDVSPEEVDSPAISAPEGAYDLQVTTIGDVGYETTDGDETGTVFEYTYVKDGIRTTCSAIHTDGINETGLSGSCRFEPEGGQPPR